MPPPPSGSIGDATSPPSETTWPAYYRELLAFYEAVQHFRHILEAQHCTIYTDHKPITYAFSQRREQLPLVQQNQLSFIAQFTTDVRHINGKENVVADALSCVSSVELPTVTTDALADAQKTDTELQQLFENGSFIQLQKVGSTDALYCDKSTGRHVHIDIIGPLPTAGPYHYCLNAIDGYTRWPEVWPLERITAEDVASAFFSGWVSRFGTPRRVTTDKGRQFESQHFRLLGFSTGFERSWTASYHLCAHGMIERFQRQFKASIMCHPHSTWLEALPAVALSLRATFKPDIQATPAELVYGEPLRLPGELLSAPTSDVTSSDPADFFARLRRTMGALRPSPAARHTKLTPFMFKDLATCSHAFLHDNTVRAPFQPPYSGPYKVICRDDKTFTLQISEKNVRVSIDRLKPSYILSQEPTNPRTPPVFRRQQPPMPRLAPYTTRLGRHVRVPNPLQP
ncbi:uncharacterized protein LOC142765699 [Rhipicephalus microplus]|uniref:uncharacterized protein LOC142765699 n=1 Tax=Rhipicephalus microplus TaxID=6941 RepID=UPI003F6C74E2